MKKSEQGNKPTHTPGPWDQARSDSRVILGPSLSFHGRIAEVPSFKAEDQANARLIAAAPETAAERDLLKKVNAELLAALNLIVDECDDEGTYDGDYRVDSATIGELRAAGEEV